MRAAGQQVVVAAGDEGWTRRGPQGDPLPARKFTGKYEHRTTKGGIGHNLPQQALQTFAQAVVDYSSLAENALPAKGRTMK